MPWATIHSVLLSNRWDCVDRMENFDLGIGDENCLFQLWIQIVHSNFIKEYTGYILRVLFYLCLTGVVMGTSIDWNSVRYWVNILLYLWTVSYASKCIFRNKNVDLPQGLTVFHLNHFLVIWGAVFVLFVNRTCSLSRLRYNIDGYASTCVE